MLSIPASATIGLMTKKTVPLDEIEQAVRRLVLKQAGASSPENPDQEKSSAGFPSAKAQRNCSGSGRG